MGCPGGCSLPFHHVRSTARISHFPLAVSGVGTSGDFQHQAQVGKQPGSPRRRAIPPQSSFDSLFNLRIV
jgi:hypothetical protein